MIIFTSCTVKYIPKAKVLAASIHKHNPSAKIALILCDSVPSWAKDIHDFFNDVMTIEDFDILDKRKWIFQHSVVELCTAIKGAALNHYLRNSRNSNVVYLDPDIMVLDSLQDIDKRLENCDILLTPHNTKPQLTVDDVKGNELIALRNGIYNLGFLAVAPRDNGIAFSEWWMNRLYDYCYAEQLNGLFTDQKWCDMVPALFERVNVIKDPSYNVASWNLMEREIKKRGKKYLANGVQIKFYHFTGFDSGRGETMTRINSKGNNAVSELWKDYRKELKTYEDDSYYTHKWKYGYYENGREIPDSDRIMYRKSEQLRNAIENPFSKTWTSPSLSNLICSFRNGRRMIRILRRTSKAVKGLLGMSENRPHRSS